MKNNQESKSFWKGKGFYLALTLVIAGAATASFLAINSMMDKLGADPAPQIQGEEDIPWQEEQHTPVEEKQEDVPVAPTSPSSSSKPQSTVSSAPSSSPASSAPAAPASSQPVQTPSFASPRAGAALQAFSGDELVFNDTMKDWRTHNGMDLAGAAGDAVTAPTGAVVARAYEDPQWGGVCRNICDNLCRLGLTVELCSAVGGDAYGDMLRGACTAAGIGTRHLAVFPAQNTSAYISIMDSEGDMLVAMSDMHILKEALTPSYVEGLLPVLNGADVCVADANLSAGALETLATRCTVPLMLDPVSTAWARNAAPLAGYFHTLKPNLMEMEVLSGMRITNERELDAACGMLLEKGVYQVFVSLGREGLYFRRQGCGALRKTSRPFPMKNATGAGDATMAGIVYAWVNGLSPGDTLDFALGAGLAAIDSADTINPAMSPALVAKLVKEYVL